MKEEKVSIISSKLKREFIIFNKVIVNLLVL